MDLVVFAFFPMGSSVSEFRKFYWCQFCYGEGILNPWVPRCSICSNVAINLIPNHGLLSLRHKCKSMWADFPSYGEMCTFFGIQFSEWHLHPFMYFTLSRWKSYFHDYCSLAADVSVQMSHARPGHIVPIKITRTPFHKSHTEFLSCLFCNAGHYFNYRPQTMFGAR